MFYPIFYKPNKCFALFRLHISNQLHLRNRRIFNKSWNRVIKYRRLVFEASK